LAAIVTFSIKNNAWFLNAFRFGVLGDTSWSFTGKEFLCDLKSDPGQTKPDLSLASDSPSPATILVLDPINRVLQFNVTDILIQQKLQLGPYNYDLIMVNTSTGERDTLMSGVITVVQGITLTAS
jgi:hypothetical protein